MRFIQHPSLLRLLPAAVLLAVVALAACNSSECLENKNALPLAGFYSSESTPRAISLDSISIVGVGAPGDSVLHDSVRNLSETYLPFRIDQPQTVYRIDYLAGEFGKYRVSDQITFNYDIQPWFVSSACGASYRYRITSIETTHNLIDSVVCPLDVIDNTNIQNIRIYFRVQVQEEGGDE